MDVGRSNHVDLVCSSSCVSSHMPVVWGIVDPQRYDTNFSSFKLIFLNILIFIFVSPIGNCFLIVVTISNLNALGIKKPKRKKRVLERR